MLLKSIVSEKLAKLFIVSKLLRSAQNQDWENLFIITKVLRSVKKLLRSVKNR